MRLFRYDIPCGCDSRREIMFKHGKLGLPEAAILAAAALTLIVAYKVR